MGLKATSTPNGSNTREVETVFGLLCKQVKLRQPKPQTHHDSKVTYKPNAKLKLYNTRDMRKQTLIIADKELFDG